MPQKSRQAARVKLWQGRWCGATWLLMHPAVGQDGGRWAFIAQRASLDPYQPPRSKSISKRALTCQVNSQYYSGSEVTALEKFPNPSVGAGKPYAV